MATPAINVNDGKHKLIVAEEGERVLTPEQNKSWEMGHKNARKEPMKARIYDGGGNVPAAPDVSGLPESTNTGQVDSMSTQTPQGPPKAKSKGNPAAARAAMPDEQSSATHYESPLMNQLYDKGGEVQPGVGDRIAARAQQLLNQGKTLATPLDNEAEGFKQKQQMVDQATTPQPKTPEPNYAPVESDKINPSARYGMGKGELRLDPQGNALNPTTPQGMGASGPQRPVPSALMGKGIAYDCGGMVYDDGGIVDRVKKNLGGDEKQKEVDEYNAEVAAEKKSSASEDRPADVTTPEGMGVKPIQRPKEPKELDYRVYDEGGDVSTEDQHTDAEKQAAIAQATKEVTGQGAPVDFPGMVMPNPKGIKVQSDTDQPEHEQQRLPNGVTMKDGVYRGDDRMGKFTGDTKMDMSNPPQAEMSGEPKVQEASAKQPMMPSTAMGKPSPMTPIEQPRGNGTTDVPAEGGLPVMGEQRQDQTKVATPDALSPEMAMVKQDQKAAMLKGKDGLADLGTAKIHENMLQGGAPATPTPTAHTAQENLKNQEEQLREKMVNAPNEQERFQAEKDLAELKRRNPWGTEGNHPGVMGKIAHAASAIGQGIGQGIAPYAVNAIPGSRADIARQESIGEKGVEAAQKTETAAAEIKLKEAQTRAAGAKTPSEQVYMHAMRGGPEGGPQINPDTQKPYTDAEALQLSTGAGKAPLQQAMNELQKQINPDTGKKYNPEEAFAKASFDASNAKMNEHQKRVADYVHAHNMEDTPANREVARVELEKTDTNAKALASLPYAEQKTKFSSDLATTRALLVQQNADANTRGLKADETQNTENARYDKVNTQIQLAKEALASSDDSQFAANIVPLVSLLTTTTAEGVKRVNKQELDQFVPAQGSLGRWIDAHADKWLAGEIPPQYKKEVGEFLDKLGNTQDREHSANTQSIDATIRQGAQQPTQAPTGGATEKPAPSKPQTIERHADVPVTAQSQYKDKSGNVVGYKDANGTYVPLNK